MMQMPTRIRPAVVLLMAAATIGAGSAAHGQSSDRGLIRWDVYGIPHIYAGDRLEAARGLGYAEMENEAETLLMNVAVARGRSAEYLGPGAGNANVTSDIQVRTEGIPLRAAVWLAAGGVEQAAIIAAFVAGANEYASTHIDTIDPKFRRVLPLVGTDITAAEQNTIHFTFMPEQDNIPALLSAWKSGGIASANALARSLTPGGSNGWAIGPSKSTDGNAILMGNPHLPWGNNQPIPGLGLYQWMEANIVIGDPARPSLNATGVVFPSIPFLGIGYTDDIGWTHTNNTIQNANLFQLTLEPNGFYKYGSLHLPVLSLPDSIRILQPDGSFTTRNFSINETVVGPIVARNGNDALALKVAGLDQPSLVTQYWRMIEAKNLNQFIAANAMLQMPFFNVIYADRDGHIMYVFGGRQPVRPGGTFGDYDGILDGSDPALNWSSTYAWNQLPRAIDPAGGFVANSNNPPWTSTFPATPTNDIGNFPAWIAPSFMDLRPQNAASFLQSQKTFTPASLLVGKESTHMELADRVLPDLVAAAAASSDPIAQAASRVLEAWDRSADAGSRGAVLFEAWWNLVSVDPNIATDKTINFYSPHPAFVTGWSALAPLTTPNGLANPASCLPDLITAANKVMQDFGTLDVAWGDVHKTVLVTHDSTFMATIPLSDDPASGPDSMFGPIRVVTPFPAQDGTNNLWSYAGDGWVQLVEFTKHGAVAQELLGYGNASRPNSPHVTDQLSFFNAKTLRPAWRTLSDVETHTVTTESY